MTRITLAIPKIMAEKMKRHPEIRWSRIARQAIEERVKLLEALQPTTEPGVSEEEAVRLALKLHHTYRRKGGGSSYQTNHQHQRKRPLNQHYDPCPNNT